MPEAAAARVHLHEERAGLLRALQFDEVIAATETAELIQAPFGQPLPAPRYLPIVSNRNAMPLRTTTIKRRPIPLDVILRAAAHQAIELRLVERAELHTL